MTDFERLEAGLTTLNRAEALQYWSAYKRWGTSQKNPIDAIFDLIEGVKVEDRKKEDLKKLKLLIQSSVALCNDVIDYNETFEALNQKIDDFETKYKAPNYYGIGSLSVPNNDLSLKYCLDVYSDVIAEIDKQIKGL